MVDTTQRPTSAFGVPSSPVPRRTKRPAWLDFRLVFGVILVLVAVLVGAEVISSADKRHPVWALRHDVAAGATLQLADLTTADVQLGSAGSGYVSSRQAVVGRAVQHDLRAGQLLPAADLVVPSQGVTVTVPVPIDNAPDLHRSDRITVWISTKVCRAVPILSGVTVQEVSQGGGSGFTGRGTVKVVLTVPAADARRVISALDLDGVVLRAGLLARGQDPEPVATTLAECVAGGPGAPSDPSSASTGSGDSATGSK